MQSVGSRSQLSAGLTSDSSHQVSTDEQEEGVAMPIPHFDPCLFSVDSSVCFDRLYVCLVQKKLCVFCIYVFISCMYVLCMVCFVYIYVVPNFSHRLLVDMAAMGKVSGHVQDIKALRMNCTFICICICIVFIFVACIVFISLYLYLLT